MTTPRHRLRSVKSLIMRDRPGSPEEPCGNPSAGC